MVGAEISMVGPLLVFLLQNLKDLLFHYGGLVCNHKENLELLMNEISTLKAWYMDLSRNRNESEVFKELMKQITSVIYDAEDEIDRIMIDAAKLKHQTKTKRYFTATVDIIGKRGNAIKRLIGIVQNVNNNIKTGWDSTVSGDEVNTRRKRGKIPVVEEENVIGFDDEARKVMDLLLTGSKKLEVVSIVGMPGLGKTTLAKMIFRNPDIEYEFFSQAWIYVSQDYDAKEILSTVLSSLVGHSDDMRQMNEDVLARRVSEELKNNKYLIVMDDVWSEEAWDRMKGAFPNNNKGSRILMTSRNTNVARYANPMGEPHKLRLLTPEESWRLLQIKALGAESENCRQDLVEHGKRIVKECNGLPLAIVVTGGVLLKKGTETGGWEKVANSVDAYIREDVDRRMERIIAMSYDYLSYHLKPCFLYLGMFPEDHEIPVSKLIQLWIAEGFVQEMQDMSLEAVAEDYLEHLVDINLVMVEKRKLNGQIKTCRVHDMLHLFCKTEADKANFFHEIKKRSGESGSQFQMYRLCIHSRVSSYLSSTPDSTERARSFLSFSSEETPLEPKHLSAFPKVYERLRVFDAGNIKFPKYPTCLKDMIHLRYVLLSGNFKTLPASISSLWNLQTLVLMPSSSHHLEIKVDIRNMSQLRHLKTNVAITKLSGCSTSSSDATEMSLQTLNTISPESCTKDLLSRASNLKSLGIRGTLTKLMENKIKNRSTLFDEFSKLNALESLKLINDTFPLATSIGGQLRCLPPVHIFPPNLRKLTLSDTLLNWGNMSILATLGTLKILKLKDRAFVGEKWEVSDGGFCALRVLFIEKIDLVTWIAEAHHFPQVTHLYVRHCNNLDAIPNILSLQFLQLHYCSKAAAASAREIEKMRKDSNTKKTGFKLKIEPHGET